MQQQTNIPAPSFRDHMATWLFEFAVACCFITPLVLFRFDRVTGYTYTFVFGRTELSHTTVAAAFAPIGLMTVLLSWVLNHSRKRREYAICTGVLTGHAALMYGLPMLPEGASELPDLFYICLAIVVSVSLVLIAAVDRRKQGSPLGFVLGLYFSPALMVLAVFAVHFALHL